MKISINCMIFDFGGVIGFPHDKTRVKKMMELTNMNKDFEKVYFLHRNDYDVGLIDKYEYWRRITNGRVELSEELINVLVKEDYCSWTKINQEVVDYIIRVKEQGVKVVLLSNINFDAKNYIKEETDIFEVFDETFCSCDLNLMKPSSAIYDHVTSGLKIDPNTCLFIDDSKENVNGATKAGINAIQFKNFIQFQYELEKTYQLCQF